jgi:hypothetical protein
LIAAMREGIADAHDAARSIKWRVRKPPTGVSLLAGSPSLRTAAHDGGRRPSGGNRWQM